MTFTTTQVDQLLRPINPKRVLRDGKGHSHVSQQDITAHLIRCFGFGNFDIDVKGVECLFESPRDEKGSRFDVCYRAIVRLTIRDPEGTEVCHYENGSTATAQNQTRGDAHDLAYKSAISLSIKRAAIALGDGFGLSLYNKGQMSALVMSTLVHPGAEAPSSDVQEGVEQQVAMGNDEVELEQPAERQPERTAPDREKSPADKARAELLALLRAKGTPPQDAMLKYMEMFDGDLKDSDDAVKIAAVTATYREVAA